MSTVENCQTGNAALNRHSGCAHGRQGQGARQLSTVLVITAGYALAEVVGGLYSNSLALLADAGHMLSDVAALGLALAALWITGRPANDRYTYGYHRAEILAALVNGAALLAIAGYVAYEAIERFVAPQPVSGPLVTGVALGGLVANLVSMAVLHSGREHSLNMRAAWLHLFFDALGSVAALAAGAAIWAFAWYWVDAAASLGISALVVYASWHLLREAIDILMQRAPRGLDVAALRQAMKETAGVIDVHHVHVWSVSSGRDALSAHVVLHELAQPQATLTEITDTLRLRYGLSHATIQIDKESPPCSDHGCEIAPPAAADHAHG